jgi:hypothetical protein
MASSFVQIFVGVFFPSMWVYRHHFRTEYIDDGHIKQDYGVEVEFDQTSRARHRDQNLIERKLGYIGKIQEIIQLDSHHFNVLFFVASGGIPSTIEM